MDFVLMQRQKKAEKRRETSWMPYSKSEPPSAKAYGFSGQVIKGKLFF